MIKKLNTLLIIILLITPLHSTEIKDVPKSDAAYKAIKKSINDGYLPLDNSQNFRPNHTISRRELAISINKLIDQVKQQNISLTTTEIKELNHLSKSFKPSYSKNESRLAKLELKDQNIQSEFNTIHADISKTNDTLQNEINNLKKQRTYMWIAIVASALLGLSG